MRSSRDTTGQAATLDGFDVYDVPFADENGEYLLGLTHAQDIMAWVTQGAIADRTRAALGSTDRGITLLRRILFRQLERVAPGADPMGVIRDPERNRVIDLPLEKQINARTNGFEASMRRHNVRYSAILEDLIPLFTPAPVAH